MVALLAGLLAATALSACSDNGGNGGDGSSGDGTTVKITFENGSVDPNGERVDAKVGEPITLQITADEPGELHVHSTPEQEIAYEPGTSSHELVIDKPGVVEVESHDLEKTVVQLEVS